MNFIKDVFREFLRLPEDNQPDAPGDGRYTNAWKTIWLSDMHLGSTQCDPEAILDFLKHNKTQKLYLVGDIIDLWALSSRVYWPTSHNTVIQKFLKIARHGTEIIYIPGNHDEFIRNHFVGMHLGDEGKGIKIMDRDVHTTIDGKRYLVVHGDEFDTITKYAKWIAKLGSVGYDFLLDLNRFYRFVRKICGCRYSDFSVSAFVKYKVKNAVQFIADYENAIITALKNEDVDGVVCGHIHHAELKEIGHFTYANDGDWVESCTALAEDFEGKLHLLDWKIEMKKVRNT
jgi:UDP-2,3-diacylglucosamine pyrophosphatase LpxH